MRKFSLIALFFLLFWNQAGYQIGYWLQQIWIEEQQREYLISLLPDHVLEKIADNPRIKWEEKGREFWYQDHLYDVARMEYINGEKVYLVIRDQKENDLAKEFLRTVLQNRTAQSEKSSTAAAIKFFQTLFFDPAQEIILLSCSAYLPRLQRTIPLHSDYLQEILIPPPQYS